MCVCARGVCVRVCVRARVCVHTADITHNLNMQINYYLLKTYFNNFILGKKYIDNGNSRSTSPHSATSWHVVWACRFAISTIHDYHDYDKIIAIVWNNWRIGGPSMCLPKLLLLFDNIWNSPTSLLDPLCLVQDLIVLLDYVIFPSTPTLFTQNSRSTTWRIVSL